MIDGYESKSVSAKLLRRRDGNADLEVRPQSTAVSVMTCVAARKVEAVYE